MAGVAQPLIARAPVAEGDAGRSQQAVFVPVQLREYGLEAGLRRIAGLPSLILQAVAEAQEQGATGECGRPEGDDKTHHQHHRKDEPPPHTALARDSGSLRGLTPWGGAGPWVGEDALQCRLS